MRYGPDLSPDQNKPPKIPEKETLATCYSPPCSLIFLASAGSCDQTKTNHLKYQQKKEHLLLTTLHPCSLIFLASAGNWYQTLVQPDQTKPKQLPAKERMLVTLHPTPRLFPLNSFPQRSSKGLAKVYFFRGKVIWDIWKMIWLIPGAEAKYFISGSNKMREMFE